MQIQTIRGIFDSNTFIAEDDGTIIIIDAGAKLNDLCDALNGRKPAAVLLTHEHFDHVYYIADYCREFNCSVYCHNATLQELKNDKFKSRFGEVKRPETFCNFIPLDGDCTFEIGLISVNVIACPGHSHGSICYLINDILFTGDVLFKGVIGRTDLIPNGETLMQQTLRKLQTLFKSLYFGAAYHGHGRPSTHTHQQENIANYIME